LETLLPKMVPQDLEKLLNKRDVSTEKVEKAE
jgi:hypothetical protein